MAKFADTKISGRDGKTNAEKSFETHNTTNMHQHHETLGVGKTNAERNKKITELMAKS